PWTKTLDLRVTKNVHTAGGHWTVFADLRNLLDFTNTTDVYAETGTENNDLYRQNALSDEYASLQDEASLNGALLPGGTVDLRPGLRRACPTPRTVAVPDPGRADSVTPRNRGLEQRVARLELQRLERDAQVDQLQGQLDAARREVVRAMAKLQTLASRAEAAS